MKIGRISFLILFLAVMTCFTGCSGTDANNAEEGVTTSFEEDTVFTVADKRVSLAEWYLYALPAVDDAESMYGKAIWDYVVDTDGTTMLKAMKEDIREQITYIKIVSGRAEQLGISLSEDDQIDINIQTEDFMSRLGTGRAAEYGITPELVKAVYADNILAMKVYENLTLNIDTAIPEDEVRHMVLEYVMIMKDYENEDGEIVKYSDLELAEIRSGAEAYLAAALADTEITHLAEINDDRYSVVELIADYATLVEKFPDNLPGIAFSLRQDEINGLYETDDAFFILDCVKHTDEDTTNAARIEIIEARQKALFEEEYSKWKEAAVVKLNYNVWDGVMLK